MNYHRVLSSFRVINWFDLYIAVSPAVTPFLLPTADVADSDCLGH
ncbi:hypothetical protein XBO1_870005 [Xenorhabdus bovienii str. oregonense]|uniref:Uncharacterized protein n=1 Tax=Xenorhabdus bovienii str. oregonense TaxID=1398202 RepID=A0A077PAK5_XENBV|nr:hypothetical protein XBO1_870005 [Xenorhabdus bovienii str. oregonense]